jgi:hypothetical protein
MAMIFCKARCKISAFHKTEINKHHVSELARNNNAPPQQCAPAAAA